MEGNLATLTDFWEEHQTEEGDTYYFNRSSGVNCKHPCFPPSLTVPFSYQVGLSHPPMLILPLRSHGTGRINAQQKTS